MKATLRVELLHSLMSVRRDGSFHCKNLDCRGKWEARKKVMDF